MMSEERAKILKLLKEGRITVEEAELLLDALEEGNEGEATAHAAREQTGGEERGSGCRDWWGSHDWGEKWGKEWRGPWRDFDFSRFQTGFEGAFRGMEQSIRDAFKNFSNINFEVELGRLFGREHAEVERHLVFPAAGIRALFLKNAWGDAEIVASEGKEVKIAAKIAAWGHDSATASATASGIEITQLREGDRLVVQHRPANGSGSARYKVDFEIAVPRDMEVELKGMSGNLRLSGTRGKTRLLTLSGDIRLRGVAGEIVADSKSGDIEAERCTGSLEASTVSGEIAILDHHGRIVAGRTVRGDIRANLTLEDGAAVDLRTVRGDIHLKVPAKSAVEIAAETVGGEIDCALPVLFDVQGPRKIHGVLNRADGKIGLSTKSGSISIRSLD